MEADPLLPAFLLGWAVAAGVMLVLWVRQLSTRNATAVDVAWAANLGVLAVLAAVQGDGAPHRRVLIAVIAAISSWRLAGYLALQRLGHAEEDGRYATIRAEKGASAPTWFFVFYQAQGLLDAVLALPFFLAARDPSPEIRATEIAGLSLWLIAMVGEAVADAQLAAWKRDPKNRGVTCRVGLWAWSRHPNYFFEWLTWIAYALVATATPMGWLGWVPAGLMLFFILKVTGIPPTEAQALKSRPDYADYQREVNAFVPWFPRRKPA